MLVDENRLLAVEEIMAVLDDDWSKKIAELDDVSMEGERFCSCGIGSGWSSRCCLVFSAA